MVNMETEANQTGSLQVPGARLYIEMRSSWPFLLLIAVRAGDAASFAHIRGNLFDHYTVTISNRRGYARSLLHDRPHAEGSV
jgi:hypothetical protein